MNNDWPRLGTQQDVYNTTSVHFDGTFNFRTFLHFRPLTVSLNDFLPHPLKLALLILGIFLHSLFRPEFRHCIFFALFSISLA